MRALSTLNLVGYILLSSIANPLCGFILDCPLVTCYSGRTHSRNNDQSDIDLAIQTGSKYQNGLVTTIYCSINNDV